MRALLRRQTWRPVRFFARYQHDLPHKEYFQNPGQTPLPDATAYTPPRPPAFRSPSYFQRAFRSAVWATLFSTLGLVGGISLLTWDYLQPPFEPGSEEDQEMLAEIETMMDTHPLVQGLRDGGWTEKSYKPAQIRYLQTLSGTQGLTLRGFQLPSSGYTILVFYAGSGLEGWPDVIHGGLITTLFHEAVVLHFNEPALLHSSAPDGKAFALPYTCVVDFREPIRPGEIYSILLPPSGIEPIQQTEEERREFGTFADLKAQGMLMRMDEPPEINVEIDDVAQTRVDKVVIPTRSSHSGIFAQATYGCVVPHFSEEEAARFEKATRIAEEESRHSQLFSPRKVLEGSMTEVHDVDT